MVEGNFYKWVKLEKRESFRLLFSALETESTKGLTKRCKKVVGAKFKASFVLK